VGFGTVNDFGQTIAVAMLGRSADALALVEPPPAESKRHPEDRKVREEESRPAIFFALRPVVQSVSGTASEPLLLFDNTARAINGASQEVLERQVANCRRADPAYGDGVARALKLNVLKAA